MSAADQLRARQLALRQDQQAAFRPGLFATSRPAAAYAGLGSLLWTDSRDQNSLLNYNMLATSKQNTDVDFVASNAFAYCSTFANLRGQPINLSAAGLAAAAQATQQADQPVFKWENVAIFGDGATLHYTFFPVVFRVREQFGVVPYIVMLSNQELPAHLTSFGYPVPDGYQLPRIQMTTAAPLPARVYVDIRHIADEHAKASILLALNGSNVSDGYFLTIQPLVPADLYQARVGQFGDSYWAVTGASMGLAVKMAVLGAPSIAYTGFSGLLARNIVFREGAKYADVGNAVPVLSAATYIEVPDQLGEKAVWSAMTGFPLVLPHKTVFDQQDGAYDENGRVYRYRMQFLLEHSAIVRANEALARMAKMVYSSNDLDDGVPYLAGPKTPLLIASTSSGAIRLGALGYIGYFYSADTAAVQQMGIPVAEAEQAAVARLAQQLQQRLQREDQAREAMQNPGFAQELAERSRARARAAFDRRGAANETSLALARARAEHTLARRTAEVPWAAAPRGPTSLERALGALAGTDLGSTGQTEASNEYMSGLRGQRTSVARATKRGLATQFGGPQWLLGRQKKKRPPKAKKERAPPKAKQAAPAKPQRAVAAKAQERPRGRPAAPSALIQRKKEKKPRRGAPSASPAPSTVAAAEAAPPGTLPVDVVRALVLAQGGAQPASVGRAPSAVPSLAEEEEGLPEMAVRPPPRRIVRPLRGSSSRAASEGRGGIRFIEEVGAQPTVEEEMAMVQRRRPVARAESEEERLAGRTVERVGEGGGQAAGGYGSKLGRWAAGLRAD